MLDATYALPLFARADEDDADSTEEEKEVDEEEENDEEVENEEKPDDDGDSNF